MRLRLRGAYYYRVRDRGGRVLREGRATNLVTKAGVEALLSCMQSLEWPPVYSIGWMSDPAAVSIEDTATDHAGWTEHPQFYRVTLPDTSPVNERYDYTPEGVITSHDTAYYEHDPDWMRTEDYDMVPDVPYTSAPITVGGFFLSDSPDHEQDVDPDGSLLFSAAPAAPSIVLNQFESIEVGYELQLYGY